MIAIREKIIIIMALTVTMVGIFLICPNTVFAEEEDIVLEVYEDSVLKESFTEADLKAIWQGEGGHYYTYSALSAFPTYEPVEDVGGPTVGGILEASGIDQDAIKDYQSIEIKDGSGVGMGFLKSQIFANRFYFQNASAEVKRAGQAPLATSWEVKTPVPSILIIDAEEERYQNRLIFGQVSPNEQNWAASIQNVISDLNPGSIIVHSEEAEPLNAIQTTNLGKSGPALKGNAVVFDRSINPNPSGFTDRYTIYFTTDGTDPDPASPTSQIYNYNNYNFGTSSEKINKPVIPNGSITIKTKVVRYGKQDSAISNFTFTGVTAPGKVTGVKVATTSYQSIKTTWSSVTGASGYQVGRYDSSKKAYVPVKNVSSGSTLTFTNSGLKTGTTYYFRVRAYKTVSGKTFYGSWSDKGKATPVLSKTTISSITAKSRALRLTWKKVAGANGYQIYRATKKSGSYKLVKTIGKQGTISWTNSNLKKKKTYWYKVRAYRVVSGKKVYSSFSAVRYKKTK